MISGMNLTPDQKRAVLDGVDLSDAEQVFDAVAAALIAARKRPGPMTWARPDELDRLSDPQITGRACFLSKEKRERCTVPLYGGAPDDQGVEAAEEAVRAAIRTALAVTRNAASQLEDVQFRGGMEAACDEIETRLSLTVAQQKEEVSGSGPD